jgi:hypothetical protein
MASSWMQPPAKTCSSSQMILTEECVVIIRPFHHNDRCPLHQRQRQRISWRMQRLQLVGDERSLDGDNEQRSRCSRSSSIVYTSTNCPKSFRVIAVSTQQRAAATTPAPGASSIHVHAYLYRSSLSTHAKKIFAQSSNTTPPCMGGGPWANWLKLEQAW